jgi:hypothetical protein
MRGGLMQRWTEATVRRHGWLAAAGCASSAWMLACDRGAPPADPTAIEPLASAAPADSGAPTSACAFDASWLTSSSLPADVDGADSCSFHRFMWRSFAALVQPSGSSLAFETYMPNYGLFVAAASQPPTPWGQTPLTPCASAALAAKKATSAKATAAKTAAAPSTTPKVFSSITKQAGVRQPLRDEAGHDVYYGIAVNQTAYQWLTSCDLYRQGCAAQLAGRAGGVDLIEKYPQLAFPAGAVELKTAWKVLTPAEQQLGTFYTVEGVIEPDPDDPSTCRPAQLGLTGLHIVSKTPSHPEFIWATFEHRNNAPNCTDLDAEPPLGGGWTFFDKAAYDECTAASCTNAYVKGQAALVCREHPWGDSNIGRYPDGNDCSVNPNQLICQPGVQQALAANTAAMQAINAAAASAIQANPGFAQVWANYELVGNVWAVGGVVPPIAQVRGGSLSAANTTMETFVQNGQAGVQNPTSCLTCHDMVSADGKTNLPPAGLSHIFDALQPNSGGCSTGSLPAACAL